MLILTTTCKNLQKPATTCKKILAWRPFALGVSKQKTIITNFPKKKIANILTVLQIIQIILQLKTKKKFSLQSKPTVVYLI